MKKYLLTTLTLGLIATNVNAACLPMAAGGMCEKVKVVRLYVTKNETYVSTTGDETALEACTPIGGQYIRLRKSNPNYKAMHHTLLEAQVAKKDVIVRAYPDSSNACTVIYVTIDN